MTHPTPLEIADIIADKADLTPNDDGTFTARSLGGEFLVEIKVHDVTGA